MSSSCRFPRPLLLFLGLFALALVAYPGRASAAATTCYDMYGQPRQCTATEQYGECLSASADSMQQCVDDQPWYTQGGCYVARLADDFVCTTQLVESALLPPVG